MADGMYAARKAYIEKTRRFDQHVDEAFEAGWQAREQQRVTVTPEAVEAALENYGLNCCYEAAGDEACGSSSAEDCRERECHKLRMRDAIEAALLVLLPNAPAGDNEEKKLCDSDCAVPSPGRVRPGMKDGRF